MYLAAPGMFGVSNDENTNSYSQGVPYRKENNSFQMT